MAESTETIEKEIAEREAQEKREARRKRRPAYSGGTCA